MRQGLRSSGSAVDSWPAVPATGPSSSVKPPGTVSAMPASSVSTGSALGLITACSGSLHQVVLGSHSPDTDRKVTREFAVVSLAPSSFLWGLGA